MRNVLALVAMALAAAACSSTEVKKSPTPVASAAPTNPAAVASASRTTASPSAPVAGNPLKDPKNILSQRSVYFDFDDSKVKSEYQGLEQAHAKYLAQTRRPEVRIEGNCDERGSREYNLALGQRRAQAVKNVIRGPGRGGRARRDDQFRRGQARGRRSRRSVMVQNRRADIKYPGE